MQVMHNHGFINSWFYLTYINQSFIINMTKLLNADWLRSTIISLISEFKCKPNCSRKNTTIKDQIFAKSLARRECNVYMENYRVEDLSKVI